jgi:acyl-CoA synthetase (AMP-forming)/AMP-acid ligase II
MMSAGEPVLTSTVDAFLSSFAPARLDPAAFGPAYGLAEHTVGVTTSGRNRVTVDRKLFEAERKVALADDATDTLTFFGCGTPAGDIDVRIVDPDTERELESGCIGEIWVDSPSKALGYFGMPEESAETFDARLGGSPGRGYLRTGDLGFIHNGEVHVAGRCKDLIIVRGRNLYPQDLEESVYSAHPLIRPGRAVAFAALDPQGEGERVVVLLELQQKKVSAAQLDEVVHAVRSRVVSDHKVTCDEILVAPPGVILKTSSGKLRRQASRHEYESGDLGKRLLRVDTAHSRGGAP